jgi:hypothetical protein
VKVFLDRPGRSPNRISLELIFAIACLGLTWVIFSGLAVPLLIQAAYNGHSLSIFNRMITGQATHAVSQYLSDWDRLRWQILRGFLLIGPFFILVKRPEFQRALWGTTSEPQNVLADKGAVSGAWRTHGLAFVVYLALAVIFTLPGSLHPTRTLLGEGGDNYQHAWFIWEFARAITHGHNPFRTDLIHYPVGANLTWATFDPLGGALALPLSVFLGPVLTYNLSLIFQLALSAFVARLLFLRIAEHASAATVGGMVFGFSPYMLAHALAGHLSLVTAFCIPLYVLALDGLLENQNPSWKEGSLLGVALLVTALCSYQYTVFCLLFTIMVLAIDCGREGRVFLKRISRPLLVSAATFSVCFSPILAMMLGDGFRTPHSITEASFFSADLLGFFLPSPYNTLFGPYVRKMPAEFVTAGERIVYIGLVALFLAAVGFWSARGKQRRWAGRSIVGGLLFAAFSLGPTVHVLGKSTKLPAPASVFYKVDFMRFLREPGRFSVMVMLCVAMLATVGLAFLLNKLEPRWQKALLLFIVGSGLLAEYGAVPFPSSSITSPRFYTDVSTVTQRCGLPPGIRDRTVLTVPLFHSDSWKKAMWMQIMDGGRYRLVEGYEGIYPPARVQTEIDQMPIVRSLRAMPEEPVVAASDRESTDLLVRKLDLGAIVVFDPLDHRAELNYVREVFEGKEALTDACAVFETTSESSVAVVGGP